jgi:hypothetical protein
MPTPASAPPASAPLSAPPPAPTAPVAQAAAPDRPRRARGWNNLSLGHKFTLMLLAVFLGGTLITGLVASRLLQQRAESEVVGQAMLLMQTLNAVRNYTNAEIVPNVPPVSQSKFLPQVVPSYSARRVFEGLHGNQQYQDFLYKEATLNPSNPADLVDSFERDVLNRFRSQPNLTEQTGYRTLGNQEVFYVARPLRVANQSCLQCHSVPSAAPPSMIAAYGSDHGFGWQLNEIVTAQTMYVPASDVFGAARRSLVIVMAIFVVIFALAIVLINLLLRRLVVGPVGKMALLAERVSADESAPGDQGAFGVEILAPVAARGDELGESARVFQKMAQEVFNRQQALREQVQELKIEIDETKRALAVEEITDSEFFRDLRSRANEMRRPRAQPAPG